MPAMAPHLPAKGETIVVHRLEQARAAVLAAADLGVSVALQSAPGASATLGPSVFRAMVDMARQAAPEVTVTAVMDCGGNAGYALAALRHGIDRVKIDKASPAFARISGIAARYGAAVADDDRPPLDLRDCNDVGAACRKWLANGGK